MKNKQLLVLAVIFLALLLVVQGLTYLNRNQGKPQVKKMYSFTTDQIDQVELASPSETVTLQSVSGVWQLTAPFSADANTTYVTSLLNTIANLTTDGTSSTNADKQDTYQVSDTTGLKVTVSGQGKVLATFYLGKTSSDFSHTYVRADGSTAIKTAKGSLSATFNRKSGDWRNKVIIGISPDSIVSLISAPLEGAPFALAMDESGAWTIATGDTPLDQTKVATFLGAVSSLNATDFVTDSATLGLDLAKPDLTLTVQAVPSPFTLQLFTGDDKYYATLNNGTQMYVIAQYSYDSLNKRASDLM
ncbi:hypothetical protein AUK40_00190 [Candidatus Wirthbacteria bacterium CG2_30_54_11]|uniref:DUF4340 domain-containing protein n=1 Tax=Candidatus Wirthbacteria bacterium CG2_30_54_11 TaxID=1817892 RepID=A0A1J5J4S0_9BACT|nr:MAG: hypothetical protein AUK40_00190 [Candidatus Wirthbacteria bacterium CG2_30_54_11]